MLQLYAIIVAVAGAFGVIFGIFAAGEATPRLFFVVALPSSPLGFAIFGVVTVGLALGIPLLLVASLSRRLDTTET
ncbi:MAG: cox cluster protein [Haloplanus sp.]